MEQSNFVRELPTPPGIADEKAVRAFHLSVPPQPTRLHYKLCMANAIAGVLLADLEA